MTDTTTAESQRHRSAACKEGGQGRGRTADLTIFSRALYQLSYLTGLRLAPLGGGAGTHTGRHECRPERS